MPGVPSGRGCDACRKQKKKCDQARPACARCARLSIACVGAGQQRYKFHVQTIDNTRSSSSIVPATRETTRLAAARDVSSRRQTVVPNPLDSLTTPGAEIPRRLVSALQVTDVRFDLRIYGLFIGDIPQRFGTSRALDTAVGALTTAIPLALSNGETPPTVAMLRQYGDSLTALRLALSDPETMASPETLCALYLIVVLQGWLRHDEGGYPSHGEAISMILGAMKDHQTSWGGFEHSIVQTLSFLVLMESFINPRIQIDRILQVSTAPARPPPRPNAPPSVSSLDQDALIRLSHNLRDPLRNLDELQAAYDQMRIDRAHMSAAIATIPVFEAPGGIWTPLAPSMAPTHARMQTAYATLTLLAIRIAAAIRSVRPSDDIHNDLLIYANDLVTVSEQAVQYRPLGASFMPMALLAAYTVLHTIGGDTMQQDRIFRVFCLYRPDTDFYAEWGRLKDAEEGAVRAASGGTSSEMRTQGHASAASNDVDCSLTRDDMCCIL